MYSAMSEKENLKNKKFLLILLGITVFIFLCLVELKAIYWAGLDNARVFSWINGIAFIFYFLSCLFALLILFAQLLPGNVLSLRISDFHPHNWIRGFLQLVVCLFPVWFFSFSAWGFVFTSPIPHLWCFASMVIISNWLLSKKVTDIFNLKVILKSSLLVGAILVIGDKFKEVIDYPFSLYWSEGNRFWDYSLLFAKDIYNYPGTKPIFAFIDLGRQSLWGLPFLIRNIPIIIMRFWNVILFTLVYVLLGYLVFKRKTVSVSSALLLGLWTFLFLNQGPIYTPLILCAMLVWVAGGAPLLISLLLLTIAGYYANLTRYTWSVAPAIWGVLLVLFHNKNEELGFFQINWWRVIVSGFAGLFGGLVLPLLAPLTTSGATQEFQGTIITSAASTLQSQSLIWSRLLPNETFPPGIAMGILLATVPLIVLLTTFIHQTELKINFWQHLAIYGSCLTFLVVGLIASVKVGGGSNLHNLDMLFINLLLLTGIFWKQRGAEWLADFRHHTWLVKVLLVFSVVYPLYPTLFTALPYNLPSKQEQKDTLAYIQKSVNEAKNIGEVLFIDQRQLLTFGYLKDVTLVPDYEKKYLMDRAMSGDASYFAKFYSDIKSKRFSLIINEPSFIEYQSEDYYFGTENDIWVEWVAKPLSCYYRPLKTFKNVKVEILIPRVFPPNPWWDCP